MFLAASTMITFSPACARFRIDYFIIVVDAFAITHLLLLLFIRLGKSIISVRNNFLCVISCLTALSFELNRRAHRVPEQQNLTLPISKFYCSILNRRTVDNAQAHMRNENYFECLFLASPMFLRAAFLMHCDVSVTGGMGKFHVTISFQRVQDVREFMVSISIFISKVRVEFALWKLSPTVRVHYTLNKRSRAWMNHSWRSVWLIRVQHFNAEISNFYIISIDGRPILVLFRCESDWSIDTQWLDDEYSLYGQSADHEVVPAMMTSMWRDHVHSWNTSWVVANMRELSMRADWPKMLNWHLNVKKFWLCDVRLMIFPWPYSRKTIFINFLRQLWNINRSISQDHQISFSPRFFSP